MRQPGQYAGQVASFGHRVQLWSAGLVVILGVTASTSGGSYTTYATIYDRSTHQVIASNPDAAVLRRTRTLHPGARHPGPGCHVNAADPLQPGRAGCWTCSRALRRVSGTSFDSAYTATGQSFTQARVGTEFGSSPWDGA